MLRASYVGDANAVSGSAVPLQTEAAAYFARMSTSPSNAYREAVNLAIYKWKKQGTWALLKGLWLFCAETDQAALLSVIGDAPRDATKTGTPTFVASKGYEGFSNTAGIAWPITTTILADNDFFPVIAGRIEPDIAGNFIISDAGDTDAIAGHFQVRLDLGSSSYGVMGPESTRAPLMPAWGLGSSVVTFCGGARGGQTYDAQGMWGSYGPTYTRSGNYRTALITAGPLKRLSAIGYLGSAATATQVRKFISTLNELLCDLGALD